MRILSFCCKQFLKTANLALRFLPLLIKVSVAMVMVLYAQKLKVTYPVVVLNPITMVDNFVSSKAPTKMFCHNETMLKNFARSASHSYKFFRTGNFKISICNVMSPNIPRKRSSDFSCQTKALGVHMTHCSPSTANGFSFASANNTFWKPSQLPFSIVLATQSLSSLVLSNWIFASIHTTNMLGVKTPSCPNFMENMTDHKPPWLSLYITSFCVCFLCNWCFFTTATLTQLGLIGYNCHCQFLGKKGWSRSRWLQPREGTFIILRIGGVASGI